MFLSAWMLCVHFSFAFMCTYDDFLHFTFSFYFCLDHFYLSFSLLFCTSSFFHPPVSLYFHIFCFQLFFCQFCGCLNSKRLFSFSALLFFWYSPPYGPLFGFGHWDSSTKQLLHGVALKYNVNCVSSTAVFWRSLLGFSSSFPFFSIFFFPTYRRLHVIACLFLSPSDSFSRDGVEAKGVKSNVIYEITVISDETSVSRADGSAWIWSCHRSNWAVRAAGKRRTTMRDVDLIVKEDCSCQT